MKMMITVSAFLVALILMVSVPGSAWPQEEAK